MSESYGELAVQARKVLGQARLDDPGEHFPYKHGEITALIEENPPAGPGGTTLVDIRIRDFTSPSIADASQDYVAAQAAYLADPTEETKAAYQVAADLLVEARRRHRANRPDGPVVTGIRGAE